MEEDRYTRITLRIPRDLHARLDEEADKTSKSLNAEIIARLQSSFTQGGVEREELVQLVNAVIDQRISGNITLPALTMQATGGPAKRAKPKPR